MFNLRPLALCLVAAFVVVFGLGWWWSLANAPATLSPAESDEEDVSVSPKERSVEPSSWPEPPSGSARVTAQGTGRDLVDSAEGGTEPKSETISIHDLEAEIHPLGFDPVTGTREVRPGSNWIMGFINNWEKEPSDGYGLVELALGDSYRVAVEDPSVVPVFNKIFVRVTTEENKEEGGQDYVIQAIKGGKTEFVAGEIKLFFDIERED